MIDDGRAIFQQVADHVADSIIDGTLPEETRAPSTNELAAFYRINPATAAKGINLLVDQGVLYKKRGVGMFVAAGARAALSVRRREAFADRFVTPLLVESRRLNLTADDVVALIHERSTTIDQPSEGVRP
ncbi:GntR family transcriptional regulator [Gordonia sp. PS3]|uniref:GntR family transcriptional regulator n=1 Tax=Gordonia TaxID=2053 RepID=UPI0005EEEF00|nr:MULTISPECIES: GntR family transcriptional regulator [Gordonia]KJR06269.1 GntR family transcriptional regulator [Gordonia sihwensis]KXT56500.1 GntR family transcriptional regulator [Gordonia sp. QH-12]